MPTVRKKDLIAREMFREAVQLNYSKPDGKNQNSKQRVLKYRKLYGASEPKSARQIFSIKRDGEYSSALESFT